MKQFVCLSFLAWSLLSAHADQHRSNEAGTAKSSYRSVQSPGGFTAHYLRFVSEDGDPEGRVFIEKDGQVIASLIGVRAVSFSPKKDVLLVREDEADDDPRHYLLDIGAGQYRRSEPRNQYVFGSRFVTRAEWSPDGQHLVLYDYPGTTDSPPEVVTVADKLGKAK